MKILETERLLLRGLEQGDFKDVCKLLQDDEVMYAYEGAFNDQVTVFASSAELVPMLTIS